MPSFWYYRERRTRPIVKVWFARGWNQASIAYNDETLGTCSSREEVEAGQSYTAKDGSVVTIKLARGRPFPVVTVDGKPLIGTVGDPLRVARSVFFLFV